jgi:hypothetical protein
MVDQEEIGKGQNFEDGVMYSNEGKVLRLGFGDGDVTGFVIREDDKFIDKRLSETEISRVWLLLRSTFQKSSEHIIFVGSLINAVRFTWNGLLFISPCKILSI